MTLESIQKRIEQLDIAKERLKIIKVTLEDALMEDEKFQEVDAQLRDLTIQKKKIKNEIWSQSAYQGAVAEMRDVKEEIADTSDILNHELLEWRQKNNSEEIVGSDGTTRRLKISVRLQPLGNS